MIIKVVFGLCSFTLLAWSNVQSSSSSSELAFKLVFAAIVSFMGALLVGLFCQFFIVPLLPTREIKTAEWTALNFEELEGSYRYQAGYKFYAMEEQARSSRFLPYRMTKLITHSGERIIVKAYQKVYELDWCEWAFGKLMFTHPRYEVYVQEDYFEKRSS